MHQRIRCTLVIDEVFGLKLIQNFVELPRLFLKRFEFDGNFSARVFAGGQSSQGATLE
jgi:hypothetical protein